MFGARVLFLACLVVASFVIGHAAAQTDQPPVEAFGNLPFLSQPVLSPSGRYLAMLQENQGRNVVVIYDTAAPGSRPVALAPEEGIVDELTWASDDRLLMRAANTVKRRIDTRPYEWARLTSITPQGTNAFVLMASKTQPVRTVDITTVSDIALNDPTHVYMPRYDAIAGSGSPDTRLKRSSGVAYSLYRVDVTKNEFSLIERGNEDTVRFILDGNGKPVARIDRSIYLKDSVYAYDAGRGIAEFDVSGEAREAAIHELSEDGKTLVVSGRFGKNTIGAYPLDLVTGKIGPALFVNPQYDLDSVVVDEWTHRVIGVRYVEDRRHTHYFDVAREKLRKSLEVTFPGLTAEIVSSTVDGKIHVVVVEGPRHSPTFHMFDSAAWKMDFLGPAYPNLEEAVLGEMRSYNYKARDGLEIPAYLTLPPGRDARNLPAVVMPHGGPELRDARRFHWWAQFLANRGYAVLQPNFRGSAGYGGAFVTAAFKQWGLDMQDDVTDGVKKMIADGIADPKRVCIVGASYGGYSALAGAAFTPDLYACAVSVAGVADLPTIIGHGVKTAGAKSASVSYWESRIGSRHTDIKQLKETSPARQASRVQVPILLLHGDRDTTVPILQSQLMADALKAAGKTYEFIRLEGDDHSLDLGASRIRVLTETERFLRAHIGS